VETAVMPAKGRSASAEVSKRRLNYPKSKASHYPELKPASMSSTGFWRGIVPGSVILLAGEPGIGKSTLITQLCLKIAKDSVYVCGEESQNRLKCELKDYH